MRNTCDSYLWAGTMLIITSALYILALIVSGLRMIIRRKRHERANRRRSSGYQRRSK